MQDEKEITDIKSMYPSELRALVGALSEKGFRADQIFDWLHRRLCGSYNEMTNLPAALREKLSALYPVFGVSVEKHLVSALDKTEKFLFALHDGNVIESVLMRYKHGNSVCISSQVGCNMGCRFCASTLEGCVRNLTASEMLSQVYEIQKISGERVDNVVVMGSGEPLDNYDNLIRFIRLLTDPKGLNISQRSITVSTCGLADRIRRLADEGLSITLALSLHAPDDEKRLALMPVAKAYPMDRLMDACRYYFEKTGRRISFEYALVQGTNDGAQDAKKLAALIAGMGVHVNLIPVNPVKETGMKRPGRKACIEFAHLLTSLGVNATIRRELGPDINAACGQLRRSHAKPEEGTVKGG